MPFSTEIEQQLWRERVRDLVSKVLTQAEIASQLGWTQQSISRRHRVV
jgi:IS30 family transposase